MSVLTTVHFLKIYGIIGLQSKDEFERTVRFACGLLPEACLEKNLSSDVFSKGEYYFFSSWSTELSLRKFIESNEYQLVRSAYDALGILTKIEIGFEVELKTILIHHS